jgi:UTP--glucose-1-phosphate uridylyltransferase
VLAYEFSGIRYDCGTKLGYLKATIALALKHPEVREEFAAYLALNRDDNRGNIPVK